MNEERIEKSTTRIFKAVFPDRTNHYDTLFGGTAMHLFLCSIYFQGRFYG
jgi:acyl-CoA hydrolase